jgi:hypothetical protein
MIANIHQKSDNRPQPNSSGINLLKNRALVHVTFGRIDRECEGLGICKVTMVQDGARINRACCSGLAVVSLSQKDELELSFLKSGLSESQKQQYFSDNQFVMENGYSFPTDLCQLLGKTEIYFPAGWYPLENELSFLTLRIKN